MSWIEYLKAFFWIPTIQTRTVKVYEITRKGKVLQVMERQRLMFGRWGRFRWKKLLRFVTGVEESINS